MRKHLARIGLRTDRLALAAGPQLNSVSTERAADPCVEVLNGKAMVSRINVTSSLRTTAMRRSFAYHLTSTAAATIQAFSVYALLTFLTVARAAPTCESSHSPDLAGILGFRQSSSGALPGGWTGGPLGTLFRDHNEIRGDANIVRIERHVDSPSQFSSFAACVQMDFVGETIELRGRLRTQDVKGFAGLWLREDGDQNAIEFDNMAHRSLHGTTGWTEYSITLPANMQGHRLAFGALLTGTGTVWASDLQLLVDGKPISLAPSRKIPKTIPETNERFDKGSEIAIEKLNRVQIDNLVTLGKVWGFLKYYDPAVTSGQQQWDDDLLHLLPAVLAAPNRASANAVMVHWIDGLGSVARCNPCAHLDHDNLQLHPDLGWIADGRLLGKALSQKLQWIRDNRTIGTQFYVALTPEVGNPIFQHERSYQAVQFPDSGFQLLALYRFWNIIEYWYPDRHGMGEDWDMVLAAFIPKLALAKNRTAYQLQLLALIAKVHDTHANLWGSLDVRPPTGSCHLPVHLRFVQYRAVVTGYTDDMQPATSILKIGDVITILDDSAVTALVKKWTPYYADSNEAARMRDMAKFMTRGPCGEASVTVRRGERNVRLKVKRLPVLAGDQYPVYHDLPGPAFRLLSPEVAYLKLSTAKASQAADYIDRAAGTKGLIIDARNYPSDFMVFALGALLVERPTPFARFTVGDLSNPGSFHWTPPQLLEPRKPHYRGKVVILVDAVTQSSAEYHSMAFRAAPGAVVVGSTTAGADGNVSRIPLPGDLHTMISGIGVFYPDQRPTQRIGIVPDVIVEPTIADIRAGRDPVLEEALRLILGTKIPISKIARMYRDPRSEPPGP